MKKQILTIAATVIGLSALAQGTVDFKNSTTTIVSNSVTMNRVVGGTAFRVVLYYLPDQATAPTTADFDERGVILGASSGFQGGSTVASGVFQGGVRSTPATTPGGGPAWFQVRAWESAFGANYAEASRVTGALVGTSNPFKGNTADPGAIPTPTAPALPALGLTWFMLYPVPEPSIIGLGILGIGALLMLRRRK